MKGSFFWRTLIIIAASFLLVLGSVFGVSYYTSVESMKQQTLAAANKNLDMISVYIDMTMDKLTKSMYQYDRSEILFSSDNEAINEFIKSYADAYSEIGCAMLIDLDRIVAIDKPILLSNNTINTSIYYKMSEENRLVITSPFYSEALGSRVIAIIRSLRNSETGHDLLLVAEIRPQSLFYPLVAKLSENETLIVLTPDGDTVYFNVSSPQLGELVVNEERLDINQNLRSQLVGLNTGSNEILIDNNKMMVRRLRYNQRWNLFIITDYSQFYRALNIMLNDFKLIGVISALITIIISYIISASIVRPVKKLAGQVNSLSPESGALAVRVKSKDEVGMLASSFNNLLKRLVETNKEKERMQREHFSLEYKVLQSQIQPHFLFNIHMCIDSLLESGKINEARKMLHSLDSLMRTSTDKISETITLREELESVKMYCELQQMRLGNTFDLLVEDYSQFADVKVPKLLLQPIVENSIYHGLSDLNRRGEIKIQCMLIDDRLHIVIEDNGKGIPKETLDEILKGEGVIDSHRGMVSIGLYNVKQRIKNFYGDDCGLYILSRDDIGTRVELVINTLL